MQAVVLFVHPISAKVIAAHYGSTTISLSNYDPLYDILTVSRARLTCGPIRDRFTEQVVVLVPDDIAKILSGNERMIADRLFRYHKNMMCWYVCSSVHMRIRGGAFSAIKDWMDLYQITEDDYGAESFYKVYQRFGWEISQKNAQFAGRIRAKKAGVLSRKPSPKTLLNYQVIPTTEKYDDTMCELVNAKFWEQYKNLYSELPVRMQRQMRLYIYGSQQQLTMRQLAHKFSISRMAANRAIRAMRKKIDASPAIKRILEESIALPQE